MLEPNLWDKIWEILALQNDWLEKGTEEDHTEHSEEEGTGSEAEIHRARQLAEEAERVRKAAKNCVKREERM